MTNIDSCRESAIGPIAAEPIELANKPEPMSQDEVSIFLEELASSQDCRRRRLDKLRRHINHLQRGASGKTSRHLWRSIQIVNDSLLDRIRRYGEAERDGYSALAIALGSRDIRFHAASDYHPQLIGATVRCEYRRPATPENQFVSLRRLPAPGFFLLSGKAIAMPIEVPGPGFVALLRSAAWEFADQPVEASASEASPIS